jgi:hypothetical protein
VPANEIPATNQARTRQGERLPLRSLAPRFEKGQHEFYYDLLLRAIKSPSSRNVALTGAYGSGKSSIIRKLLEERSSEVVEVSLSTIDPGLVSVASGAVTAASKNRHAKTNYIQKEIVKQLLYRLPPGAVPASRFHRLSTVNKKARWLGSLTGGTVLYLLLSALTSFPGLVENLYRENWRQWIAYLTGAASVVILMRMLIGLYFSRVTVSGSVKAVGATVALSRQAETYFDEYLDELIYFFQASKRRIVVIEDLDRFEDVRVFDTLRALNGLLNKSGQIRNRIVFVYAIRDSVFEQIGRPGAEEPVSTTADVEADRAAQNDESNGISRTKFFDVIIPVVPFLSAGNARDLMSQAMESSEFLINPQLIRLAARHITDMRLINNIRNEFEIFRNRLLISARQIPGISEDYVFALVVYKNAHLSDFESIRSQGSTLDSLYKSWREVVADGISAQAETLASLRVMQDLQVITNEQARALGARLSAFRDSFAAAGDTDSTKSKISFDGPVENDDLYDRESWERLQREGFQSLNITSSEGALIALELPVADLLRWVGIPMAFDAMLSKDAEELAADIDTQDAYLTFLRHHTWAELLQQGPRPRVLSMAGDSASLSHYKEVGESFDAAVDRLLQSELAKELVRSGYITSHFSLYVSAYYGEHVGPDALEFIRRVIEPGLPDVSFLLSTNDVVQVLREQGAESDDAADIFRDPSILNVSIFNYLIEKRPEAVKYAAGFLAGGSAPWLQLMTAYTNQGTDPVGLYKLVTPHWNEVLQFAATEVLVTSRLRLDLLDAVFASMGDMDYKLQTSAGEVLAQNIHNLRSLTQPQGPEEARRAYGAYARSGATIENLGGLNEAAREAATGFGLYSITYDNLRIYMPSGRMSLDRLRSHEIIYEYVLANCVEFLKVVKGSPRDVVIVRDKTQFVSILNDVSRYGNAAAISETVRLSPKECFVSKLDSVDRVAWQALVAAKKATVTFSNVTRYILYFGLDEPLGSLLSKEKKVAAAGGAPLSEIRKLAVRILGARDVIPSASTRVRLVSSLGIESVALEELEPESGDLVATLLRRGLVEDSEAIFASRYMVDWGTKEKAIRASRGFRSFMSTSLVDVVDLPHLIRSTVVPHAIKLDVYAADADVRQVREVARALIENNWKLNYPLIVFLITKKASPRQVVSLMALLGDELELQQVGALFVALGGSYSQVAHGGRGRPTFPVDKAHLSVLNRYVGRTITSLVEKDLKALGPRIVASLRVYVP